jgi:hypothetical protein
VASKVTIRRKSRKEKGRRKKEKKSLKRYLP